DSGNFAVVVLLPTGSTQADTREVIDEVQAWLRQDPVVDQLFAMQGFSYFGGGQNAGMIWPTLIDWSQRKASEQQIEAI
ncbi:TPA: efflux RND transporter permease subunit, partial [Pseudomonas aeruginosa 449A]|nr:efflux RND transporter permease subunit [Pseudomonas aeruginosa 449A]HCL2822928.1 efflux RND transporter permease subunit [Pseudomonas aeruginosa 449A]HCL2829357.1 efflux RND transporter permease subunit [Pseudomonas aeruginosa 449A]